MINGTIWKDINGSEIHAHGGHILKHGEYYYWYGENRKDNIYVSCYRSKNLKDWEFRKNVLTTNSPCENLLDFNADISLFNTENGVKKKVNIERPKVLYNEKTKKFVMWAHYENGTDYLCARCAVALCDTPDGEFVYCGSFNPLGEMSRVCTLFKDGERAYFISTARDNADLHIYLLNDSYTGIEKCAAKLWIGEYREAPAVFKKGEKYYMLSSACTGWAPNQGKWAYADNIVGEWSSLENFGDETTFRSQPAFVLPLINGKDTEFLYFGDRWGGKGENYFKSSYVVLKIKFDGNKPYIVYDEKFDTSGFMC